MTAVERVAPRGAPVPIGEVLAPLADAGGAWPRPFDPAVVAGLAALSRRLFEDPAARRHPELQALAFWLRPAALHALAERFAAETPAGAVRVPVGLIFHVPPANVDTIFAYAWALAALTGNRGVVRLSSRPQGPAGLLLLGHVAGLLEDPAHAALGRGVAFVRYGHDAAVTAAISAACDLRAVWGGDAAVAAVRAAPLGPLAREVTFGDRTSLAAIAAGPFLALPEAGRREAVRRFYNDAYWFDQLACASPRLVTWVGAPAERAAARAAFWPLLAEEVAARGYAPPAAVPLAKLLAAQDAAIRLPVARVEDHGPGVTVASLAGPADLAGFDAPGGLFFEAPLADLVDLAAWVGRRHQTLVHLGFERQALAALAATLNGRGVDRMVPVGDALAFGRLWDGHDLLAAFTRVVHVAG